MKAPTKAQKTPMMIQWEACKKEAKEALLLFRLGDFFEAFEEDAKIMAQELQLTLTQRQGIPMCGVPVHTCDSYIDKLIAKGYKIAIADQTEDPKKAKGLVNRKLVRILSPGVIFSSSLLDDKANNFFLSLTQVDTIYGLCVLDLTTSEFRWVQTKDTQQLLDEIFRLRPAEILVSKTFYEKKEPLLQELSYGFSFLLNKREDSYFEPQQARRVISSHFQLTSLEKFMGNDLPVALLAAGALLHYLKEDMRLNVSPIRSIQTKELTSYLLIDRMSLMNLDILPQDKNQFSLLSLLDKTKTPMGARLLAQWVKYPLLQLSTIQERQRGIAELLEKQEALFALEQGLEKVRDLPRLLMRIENGYASPKDLVALRSSLEVVPKIRECLSHFSSPLIQKNLHKIQEKKELKELLDKALVDHPPHRLYDAEVFRLGYCKELDELKNLGKESKVWIAQYQNQLRNELGIKTLRVSYTKAFGYYIEVSKGQESKVPVTFHRKQTLVNAERYITEALKSFEYKILTAEERIRGVEAQLFEELKAQVLRYTLFISQMAEALAEMDVLVSLAKVAREYRYVKPELHEGVDLEIIQGRHPILEYSFPHQEFIPNDTHLSLPDNQLYLITGPNMAGKSTYIRQVALIVVLAQMGSFVPAHSARIGLVDRLFSRVGASDDIARGQSTFMVEMMQTAHILNHATSRSLVILDEIGRGTSTYDGISIAWAVAEYLLTTKGKKAKTLFATHYWELTELENLLTGAVNYQVAVKEMATGIVFLRKIIRGGTDKSYGIHVAKLAGLPTEALYIAQKRLQALEKAHRPVSVQAAEYQPMLISLASCDRCKKLSELHLDQMTPFSALQMLYSLQNS